MKTLRSRIAPLRQIRSLADALLFVRIVAFASVVPLLTRLSLPRLAWVLSLPRRSSSADPVKVARFIEASTRTAAPLVRPGCLTRGITLWQFLRVGRPSLALRFGVGKVNGTWEGHCWLEDDGSPYLERTDPQPTFTVVFTVDGKRAA